MSGPVQLLKDRARLVLQRSQGHTFPTALYPPSQSCPAGATMWPWLGIRDGGNVSVRALVLGDNVRRIRDSAAVISAGRGCWGWQTEPDWTAGRLPAGRLTPLMSAHRCSLAVGAFLRPRPSHITLADHPYLKKCPARFKFSQECGPSERPPAHLDPSKPGKPCNDCSLYVFLVCGLIIGDSWEPL